MAFIKKYTFLFVGLGFLLIDLLSYFRILNDLSKNAGIAMSIIGMLAILYSIINKKTG